MTESPLTDKEWLDLAWKHFQQHAQQRLLYFNYFVIFSTILSTGIVTTFQNQFQAPILGTALALLQSFLAYIFFKIDARNRFLTKHAENVIKKIEYHSDSIGWNSYKLFTDEAIKSKRLKTNKRLCRKPLSHGEAYKIIYTVFFLLGIMSSILCTVNYFIKPRYLLEAEDSEIIIIKEKEYRYVSDSLKRFRPTILNHRANRTETNIKLNSND